MLALSWRRAPIPADYRPGLPRTDPQTPEEVAEEQRMKTGPGAWFVQKGCFVCHSVQALGVKSPAQIGPDLSTAVEDTQARFGRTVDDFLGEPTGTMAVVLSRQIVLSPEEKKAIRELYIQRLTEDRPASDEIIVPTGQLFIEALPGKHPLLEDFKLLHRREDVRKVRADVRHAELENLRLAARLAAGERADPDIEKRIIVDKGTIVVGDG